MFMYLTIWFYAYKWTHIRTFVHIFAYMPSHICRYVSICYAMMVSYVYIRVILLYKHERSYHVNCTRSRPIPEVKRRRVQPVVRCVSTCEAWILFVLILFMIILLTNYACIEGEAYTVILTLKITKIVKIPYFLTHFRDFETCL